MGLTGKGTEEKGEIHMLSYPLKDQHPSRLHKSLEINEHSSVIFVGFLLLSHKPVFIWHEQT